MMNLPYLPALLLGAVLSGAIAAPGSVQADMPGGAMPTMHQGRFAVMAESSLRNTLEGWSRASGWTLIWDKEADFRIRASAVFPGTFEEAVVSLVDSIHLDNPELSVVIYRGNRVVHVENRHSSGD